MRKRFDKLLQAASASPLHSTLGRVVDTRVMNPTGTGTSWSSKRKEKYAMQPPPQTQIRSSLAVISHYYCASFRYQSLLLRASGS